MTRREWLAAAGTVFLSACGPKKGTGYPGYALIATSGENSLAVVDLTAFRLLKSVPLGTPPSAVLPDGPGGHTFVLTPSTGSIHALDRGLRIARSGKLAGEISQVRMAQDLSKLVAISPVERELIVADPHSLDVVLRIKLSGTPVDLDLVQTAYAAVSLEDNATHAIELIDLRSGQCSRTELPGHIGKIRFRSDGKLLLAANLADPSLTAFSVPALQPVATLPLAMKPQNLCFNADQGQLFVSGEGMDGIAIVFPFKVLEVEQTILAGRDPGVMTCSANPAYLFVGSNSGSDVCVLDIGTRDMLGLVDVGQQCSYLATTPDSQYALVLDEKAGDLAVIRIPAIRVDPESNRYKSGAALFTVLPVGEKPVQVAVVPRDA